MLDRDPKFISVFWGSLWRLLGTKLHFRTSYYPQIDGQTEVNNKTLDFIHRSSVSKSWRDWDVKLSHVEFFYYLTLSYATKYSPFEVVYAINPFVTLELSSIPMEVYLHGDTKLQVELMMHVD